MRIWYDHQIFAIQEYGGVSRYFCRLASALGTQPGVETRVIAPLHINEALARSYTGAKIAVRVPHVLRRGRIIRISNQALTMAALAVSGPDVYHATYFSPPFRMVRHASARLVVTVYDMIHERYPDDFSAIDNTAERKRKAVAQADQIICISERTREDLLHFYEVDPGKTTVIHLGFDLDIPTRPLPSTSPEPYLLYVGPRQGYKNFSRLLQVYARQPKIHRQFKLLCFGGGPFTSKENQAMAELGVPPGRIEQLAGSDELLATL
jgi:glycosyltransferase involved in cell wall biosynthesis